MWRLFGVILVVTAILLALGLMAYVFDHVGDLVWTIKRFLRWAYRKIFGEE